MLKKIKGVFGGLRYKPLEFCNSLALAFHHSSFSRKSKLDLIIGGSL